MTLIKTGLLNGIAVVIKMLTLLGLNKILAVYVGPAGYAAIGQFQNAIAMITTFASGAINTGVVKYTAEYHDDESRQHTVWQTAGAMAFWGSLLVAVLIVVFSQHLAQWFLDDSHYSGVFVWFAAGLMLYVFNALLLAILNGKKEIGRYVLANIAGSLLSLLLAGILVVVDGLEGALIGLAIYQSLAFFVTLGLCIRASWFRFSWLMGAIDRQVAKNLAKFAMMALTSAVCVPVSQILVRNHLGTTFGWDYAGYWEAMWRLSTAYLMLVTTTLGVYYLPRLAELQTVQAIRREVGQGYMIILPCAAICGLIVFLLRDTIIATLFTADFSPMRRLFAMQMLGDTLKIGSWILAYLMLGKAMFRLYVVTEVVFAASFVGLTVLLTHWNGFEGVAQAHAANYFLYWMVVAFFVGRKLEAAAQ